MYGAEFFKRSAAREEKEKIQKCMKTNFSCDIHEIVLRAPKPYSLLEGGREIE
jgi:hypothetical protein